MVTIGMNYDVLPGKAETFEKSFANVLETMDGTPGHNSSSLYKDVKNASRYLIVSLWDQEEAFTNFIRSESFAKVTAWGKEQILAGRPKHTIYRE